MAGLRVWHLGAFALRVARGGNGAVILEAWVVVRPVGRGPDDVFLPPLWRSWLEGLLANWQGPETHEDADTVTLMQTGMTGYPMARYLARAQGLRQGGARECGLCTTTVAPASHHGLNLSSFDARGHDVRCLS